MRALDQLVQSKGQFGEQAARRTVELLKRAAGMRFRSPADLILLHESVLFLRTFPASPRVVGVADQILLSFADRMRGVDPEPFDDPEVSGIAGTAVSTNFSHPVARSLVQRHGRAIQIDWDNYERSDRMGSVLAKLLPFASEEVAVEAHVDSRAWFEDAGWPLLRFLDCVDPQTYDLLEIPLRWDLGSSTAGRSRLRLPRRELFYHRGALLKRSQVSIEAEFAAPSITVRPVPSGRARTVLALIVDASAARYRELHGFQHPDAEHVYHADLGRGVDLFFFGVPPQHRLPVRAYHCGMFFKNGVPMGYVETMSLFERAEVGFNLYYTFRDGETAWLYARILKFLREQLRVSCFAVDPYQLGQDNEEAIESGAFWFYRKLGFRPASEETVRLTAREEARIAKQPGYRTPAPILRKLAAAPLVYGNSDWDHFDLGQLIHAKKPALRLPEDVLRAKRAPEEVRYLRLLERRPELRRQMIRRP